LERQKPRKRAVEQNENTLVVGFTVGKKGEEEKRFELETANRTE
jgi:hypothetical protein